MTKTVKHKKSQHSRKTHKTRKTRKTRKSNIRNDKKVLWKNIKPHTEKEKMMMYRKDPNCFVDSEYMKYPICSKFNNKVECKGIYAAEYYINIHKSKKLKPLSKYKKLHNKVQSLKRKNKCGKYA